MHDINLFFKFIWTDERLIINIYYIHWFLSLYHLYTDVNHDINLFFKFIRAGGRLIFNIHYIHWFLSLYHLYAYSPYIDTPTARYMETPLTCNTEYSFPCIYISWCITFTRRHPVSLSSPARGELGGAAIARTSFYYVRIWFSIQTIGVTQLLYCTGRDQDSKRHRTPRQSHP